MNYNFGNRRILLVDDDKLNLKVEKKTLSKFNFKIDAVSNAEEAMNLIKDNGGIDNILLSSYEVPSDTIIYEEDIVPIKKTESKKKISFKTIFSLGFTCILLLVVILKTSYSFFT